MQLQTHAWENSLLSRAHEARICAKSSSPSISDPVRLHDAYARCEAITSVYSKSFNLASALLPWDKRRAVRALYAFCRHTDDLVDCPRPQRRERLEEWRSHVLTEAPPQDDLIALAWTDARLRFGIPLRYAEQLIDGVAQDLEPRCYETFEQLAAYSYGVASTVGLMSMHIIGYSSLDAMRYAIKLGVALQITNILRDVADDWQMGRLYLPTEELSGFGLSITDIAQKRVTNRWQAFMRFQIERNRRLYAEAAPGIRFLHRDGQFSILAAAELYQEILTEIERRRYDVFSGRASVSAWGKVARLPAVWWRCRRVVSKKPLD